MIIYLCMKYESNTLIFSKDIERKLFSYGTYGRTDSGDTICSPIENGGGINIYILFVCVFLFIIIYVSEVDNVGFISVCSVHLFPFRMSLLQKYKHKNQ